MAYYHPSVVRVIAEPGATHQYVWGDRTIASIRCGTCGCVTHWESLEPDGRDRMGVNARLFEDVDVGKVRIRRFDGADTWSFID